MSRLEEALKRSGTGGLFGTQNEPPAEAPAPLDSAAASEAATVEPAAAMSPHLLARRPEAADAQPSRPPASADLSGTLTTDPGPVATAAGVAEKVVVDAETNPASVEQYRRLAAVLHHAQNERGIRVIMVTSALPGEGKTLTASNLALTLSESYQRRVLLVDADLRRPSVHQLFALPSLSGLSDGLRSVEDRKLTLVEVSTRLTVLPAGRPDPDPMSVLSSNRMRHVLDEAGSTFEWVIVDTPPIGMLSDAHLLTSLVDTVLLVVEAAETPLEVIKSAVDVLGRDRILGVILNRADDALPHVRYGYDYYGEYRAEA